MSTAIVKKLQWRMKSIVSKKTKLQSKLAVPEKDEQLIVKLWKDLVPERDELKNIVIDLFEHDIDAMEDMEKFDEEYFSIECEVDKILAKLQPPTQNNSVPTSSQQREPPARLPIVELPTFSGNYDEWKSFSTEFQSLIHENTTLGNTQKFHYLRSSLKGEAAMMIKSIQMSNNAYELAWDQLVNRYQNERLVIKNHVRSILDMQTVKRDSHTSLRHLIDVVALHLASLKAINRPTDTWDDLLVEIIAEKLNPELHKEWEGETCSKTPTYPEMQEFLQRKCKQMEAIDRTRTTPSHSKVKSLAVKTTEETCVFCKGAHVRYKCRVFQNKSVEQRIELVKQKHLCFNCLGSSHSAKSCKSGNCRECNKTHHTLLHRAATPNKSNHIDHREIEAASLSTLTSHPSSVLLSTCLIHVKNRYGKLTQVRALLDSGSQANIITEKCAMKVGLTRRSLSTPIVGVGGSKTDIKQMGTLVVQSRLSDYSNSINALIIQKITDKIPNYKMDVRGLVPPAGVQLADPSFNKPQEIDLLIGAGLYYDIVNGRHLPMGPLTLISTHFGWIVAGQLPQVQATNCATVGFVGINELVSRFWEIENYKETPCTSEDRECENHFKSTVTRNFYGRFEVALPFKPDATELGQSSVSAKHRFFALERRLAKQPEVYESYREFMREYRELGHMHATSGDVTSGYYMPHHCVIKEDSLTTKLRVVFNASAPSNNGVSLNDTLMIGPTLQDDLFCIMLRMRTKPYVITADITKMYRQVNVRQKDRKYQRIWWREHPEDNLVSYELATVTYGTAPAAYLAIRSVRELAKIEETNFPVGSKICLRDFYVDDLITGANSTEELIVIRDQVTALLGKGGFELKKWASNDSSVFDSFQTNIDDSVTVLTRELNDSITTLGTIWNTHSDNLSYKCSELTTRVSTKRTILSEISRIYDPLGLIGPVIISAKILIQDLWRLKCGWDDPLPAQYLDRWSRYADELRQVKDITIPRNVVQVEAESLELHGFADASENAYGACVYIVSVQNGVKIAARLLCAKSRVAPVKSTTIPRLELCAAVLLAELCDRVCSTLDIKFVRRCFYSDSTIVLSWIKSESRKFKTFVANRVGEIQTLNDVSDWYHVATSENPADLISRRLSPMDLRQSTLWWNGPDFLLSERAPATFLPTADPPEVKCAIVSFDVEDVIPICSSFHKTVRAMAFVLRFKDALRRPATRRSGPFTTNELEEATTTIIRHLQRCTFKSELDSLNKGGTVQKSSRLTCLNPFIDHDGLLRVGGRLMESSMPLSRRCPIVILGSHQLSKLIIRDIHSMQLHTGTQATLAAVRTKYWPLNGRSVTREIVRKCIVCVRARPRFDAPIMGALPIYRTQQFRPFLKCGVDYCGPFTIKDGSRRSRKTTKVYLCVFVCFATKAVHIEVVSDLTTEAFIAAFNRLISRRGCVAEIFSDNATNFVGARNHLRELGLFLRGAEDYIRTALSSLNIKWTFIPPRAPHFGGLWEAAVKSVKHHLHRVARNALLTYTELHTLVTQIEAVLNSRPLCQLSEDPNDFAALTPGHFLIGDAITAPLNPDISDVPTNRLSRWQYVEKLRQHIWSRWQREYLSEMHKRTKWQRNTVNIEPGRLVVIREDNTPPLLWRMGRVEAVHPGPDGVTRSATVRTSSGSYVRPSVKLCPLDTSDSVNSV